MWVLAFNTWLSHPLLGVGAGNYEFMSASHDWVLGSASAGSSPHETYLYLLADFGIVGTGAVLIVLLGSIRSNLRLRGKNLQLELIGLALAFALTVNMIGWFSDDSTFFGPHTSYLVWLLVGLSESVQSLAITQKLALSVQT
jgi:O-antigen ligase